MSDSQEVNIRSLHWKPVNPSKPQDPNHILSTFEYSAGRIGSVITRTDVKPPISVMTSVDRDLNVRTDVVIHGSLEEARALHEPHAMSAFVLERLGAL